MASACGHGSVVHSLPQLLVVWSYQLRRQRVHNRSLPTWYKCNLSSVQSLNNCDDPWPALVLALIFALLC